MATIIARQADRWDECLSAQIAFKRAGRIVHLESEQAAQASME